MSLRNDFSFEHEIILSISSVIIQSVKNTILFKKYVIN